MNFAARTSQRDGKGREGMPPLALPANSFYSALVRLLQTSEDADHQIEALRLAKQYAAKGEQAGLQLALSVARIQALTVIEQIEDIAALFPPHDIDSSTQVYGERT